MEKTIQGVTDKIIVGIIKQANETTGGIIIPDSAQKDPQLYCEVISVGETVTKEINVGDIILCHANAGMDIMMERKIFKVLKAEEVYGVLKNKKADLKSIS